MALFFLFGFFVYFSSVGIFVLILWGMGMGYCAVKNRLFNKPLFVSGLIMGLSCIVFNLNLFFIIVKGEQTNRILKPVMRPELTITVVKQLFYGIKNVLVNGQYHAAPIVKDLIFPVCVFGIVVFFCKKNFEEKSHFKIWRIISFCVIGMIINCIIYVIDYEGYIRYIFSNYLTVLRGFNFGRMVYINNILWIVLFGAIIIGLLSGKKSRWIAYGLCILQMVIVICADSFYQNTSLNLLKRAEAEQNNSMVTYNEFFDTEYFDELKNRMEYKGEGTVSIGYEPAVAMYNGFNNLDAYLNINPLEYHNQFREIIEPSLDKYPALRDYYDEWGGRMYVFVGPDIQSHSRLPTKNKQEESVDVYIDTREFVKLGGKYILSRFVISNADELNLDLLLDYNGENSIYHVWVYEVAD